MMAWLTGFLAFTGATLVLLAAGAFALADTSVVVRMVSIGAFVMLTSPVSNHVIARAAYLTKVPLWKGTVIDEWRSSLDPPGDDR